MGSSTMYVCVVRCLWKYLVFSSCMAIFLFVGLVTGYVFVKIVVYYAVKR